MPKLAICLLFLAGTILGFRAESLGQYDSSLLERSLALPDKFFSSLDRKALSVEGKLTKQTDRYLSRLQRQEEKLKKKLWRKDSTLAKQLFSGIDEQYTRLRQTPAAVDKYAGLYSGHLDSITMALSFLKANGFPKEGELQKSLAGLKALQTEFNHSEQVRKQLAERQQLLREQFQQLGMVKELKRFRKEVFYYQQQVKEYQQLFDNPQRLEAKVLEVLTRNKAFQDFFARHSQWSRFFPLPVSTSNAAASVQGLQTRAAVTQTLIGQFGNSPNVASQLQQNVQSAQGQLNTLKSKLSSFSSGSYGNGDANLPEGTRMNNQKTKSFFQRMEIGTNIQTQKARYIFPVTSDIGLSLSYKLNDQALAGIGACGSIGLGRGWNNLELSYQGLGLRGNLDWKIKGDFYVAGAYEMNYRSRIRSFDQLKDYSSWQPSGLLGLSRKYQISKKIKGEMKLLWDFLSYRQVPKGQPVLFRIGYALK
ncbi:MAG TPA: hypothetical protein VGE66_20105 [Chitinophagaceae bacterium]